MPIARPPLHRSTAELAELAWSEGLKFSHLKYGGGDVCDEPFDACYQTALNRLMGEVWRIRQNADQTNAKAQDSGLSEHASSMTKLDITSPGPEIDSDPDAVALWNEAGNLIGKAL